MSLLILCTALYAAGAEHPVWYLLAVSAWVCRTVLIYGWPFGADRNGS